MSKNFWEAFFIALGFIIGFIFTTIFLHELDPNITITFYGPWSEELILILFVLTIFFSLNNSK